MAAPNSDTSNEIQTEVNAVEVSGFREPGKKNKYIQRGLKWTIESLTLIKDGPKIVKASNVYTALSPIDDVSEDDFKVYGEALAWALSNRVSHDIKNIAVTGPYGSGKSSVLRTFQKKYENENLRFLNISLAT